jgi:murein DD-endopeptidase MepM/ murein hydrolase activator NlpD
VPTPTPKPGTTPNPKSSASPTPSAGLGSKKPSATLPPGLEQGGGVFDIPSLARTQPRNTFKIVEELTPLTKYGFSSQQVLINGMGRFPVAGIAFWHDDWLEYRRGPPPHLHHGLDLFADFGTPIRSPDDGVVTGMGDAASDPLGGTHAYVRGADGTEYYFAHMMAFAEGLSVGQSVKLGQVIGFVGNTGNAQGGTPHLHFEIHRPGPIPPKPIVDGWLDQAESLAPTWVKLQAQAFDSKKRVVQSQSLPNGSIRSMDLDATMLLTLLDPVGGSVGLLPRLDLSPPSLPASTPLWDRLIRLRLDGHLLVPGDQSVVQSD